MENGYRIRYVNMYFKARKEASMYDKRLYSRERTSELLGVSVSTLADYELGKTKVVPADKVKLMSELYGCPELKNKYCLHECPIGDGMMIADDIESIEKSTLSLIKVAKTCKDFMLLDRMIRFASDGEIKDFDEIEEIHELLKEVMVSISQACLTIEKELIKYVKRN